MVGIFANPYYFIEQSDYCSLDLPALTSSTHLHTKMPFLLAENKDWLRIRLHSDCSAFSPLLESTIEPINYYMYGFRNSWHGNQK